VNKNLTDSRVCRYLFTAKLLYMFRVSQQLSSGVLKTVPAASGTGHTTCAATPLQRCLIGTGFSDSQVILLEPLLTPNVFLSVWFLQLAGHTACTATPLQRGLTGTGFCDSQVILFVHRYSPPTWSDRDWFLRLAGHTACTATPLQRGLIGTGFCDSQVTLLVPLLPSIVV